MIRINLLPTRQVKKRAAGRQVVFVLAGVLIAGLLGNYIWYESRQSESDRRTAQIADTQRRIAELEKVIGEVNNINKRKKEVQDKLKILGDLRKGRAGPVRLLDALATATPKKVFLQEFNEASNAVKLTGSALSHDDVAELMRGLTGIVWTPKGMGRMIEQRRDGQTVRVELLTSEAPVEDFPVGEVGSFFTNIDLKKAEVSNATSGAKSVNFEIALNANYAI